MNEWNILSISSDYSNDNFFSNFSDYTTKLEKIDKRKLLWISILTFFLLYLFIVGSATYEDIYAQWNVMRFDLNKDGLFSGDEITTEQTEAMRLLINDVGRNFAFFTGIIFSGLIAIFVFVSGKIIQFIRK